ncbi:MAG: hypothetical protein IJN50_00840 [Clostridia bacterium]|nr:hypothetical protein [Clostridia bacterium]
MEQNNKVNYCIVKRRVGKQKRQDGLFYYDLRHYDNNLSKYVIEENVFVNFYGTMITDRPILNGEEYLDYKDFFNIYNTVRDQNLNPFKKYKQQR